jgi:hypothetical protein
LGFFCVLSLITITEWLINREIFYQKVFLSYNIY